MRFKMPYGYLAAGDEGCAVVGIRRRADHIGQAVAETPDDARNFLDQGLAFHRVRGLPELRHQGLAPVRPACGLDDERAVEKRGFVGQDGLQFFAAMRATFGAANDVPTVSRS